MSYDFFAEEVREDPFTFFGRLRERDPVLQTDSGYWYVTRHADVVSLLRDTRLVAGRGVPDSLGITDGPLRSMMDTWMMAIDGPAHARTRRLISRSFTPRAVETLRPAVTEQAEVLLARIVEAGGGDVVAGLAFPLPMEVVRLLFGVDPATWEREVVARFDPARPEPRGGFVEQMGALAGWFQTFVPERRRALGDDMFSGMFRPGDDGEALTDDELVANAVLLVTAGFETTMGLLSLAVLTLLRHPDQLALLAEDRSLVANAVDEVLRFEPTALSTTRYATVDVEVAGQTIPSGSNVLLSAAGANRDPARYDDPDRFDVTRDDIRPVTFGGGAHSCIGAVLARMEAEAVVGALLDHAPGLRLVDERWQWQDENPTVRRPVAVQVAIAP